MQKNYQKVNKIFENTSIKTLLALWSFIVFINLLSMLSISGGEIGNILVKQVFFIIITLLFLLVAHKIKPNLLFRHSYNIYLVCVLALLLNAFLGHKAMGASRWLVVGGINIQPSEFMKIAFALALSRYFHSLHFNQTNSIYSLISVTLLMLVPTVFILKQPNLGTSIILILTWISICFFSGLNIRIFVIAFIAILSSLPIIWNFLHEYQKLRIMTFINPSKDSLGAGYNIIQSIISIGSGGFLGKGFIQGSQNQLDFLPENHTDFIFALIAEEGGFLLVLILLLSYTIFLIVLYFMSFQCISQYARLFILGYASIIFLHVFINIGMISGLLPVVGIPLPFLSYGGSNFLAMNIGLLISIALYSQRHTKITKFTI